MRVLVMATLLGLSCQSYALPTKEFPNARKLFATEKQKIGSKVIPATVFLFPALFLTREWKLYRQCKETLKYLNAAHALERQENGVLHHRQKLSDRDRRQAKRELNRLLRNLKKEIKNPLLELEKKETKLEKEEKKQLKLLKRVQKMERKDLVKLLQKADRLVPRIFGNPETGYARADTDNLIYAMTRLDNKKSSKSIFEASLKKEEKRLEEK